MAVPAAVTVAPMSVPKPMASEASPVVWRSTNEYPMTPPAIPARMMDAKAITRAPTEGSADSGSGDDGVDGIPASYGPAEHDTKAIAYGSTVARMRTLVILPTYNEAENIFEVLDRVRAAVPGAEVLVVDDGSPDGTAQLAESWAADNHGQVTVLRRASKSGLGSAYRAGFANGLERGFEALIEMDSDLQHDPAALPELIAAVANGADLAIGSRYVPGGSIPNWPKHREWLSRGGNRYAGFVLGLQVRDATAGFRCYGAPMLATIDLGSVTADGYGFQIEMAYNVARRGGRIVEVPIRFSDRQRGTSKMSGRIVFEALGLVTWWAIRDRLLRRGRRDATPTSVSS